MGTWEPGVPYTDPTPDQITSEVNTDREEDPSDPANIPLGGDLSGTTGAAVIDVEGLSALADSPPGTVPIPATALMVGVDDGGVYTWQFNTAVRTNRIDQMAVPTATLTWTGAALLTNGYTSTSGVAGDGSAFVGASSFFGGGLIGTRSNTSQSGFRSNLNVNGLGMGDGTTNDVTFERTGAGLVTLLGALRINGNVGFYNTAAISKRTGYTTAPTGTLTRTTFDSGTVTLPQLAERVAALLVDLRAYGLIGA